MKRPLRPSTIADDPALRTLLARLDTEAQKTGPPPAKGGRLPWNRRTHHRYAYRQTNVLVYIEHPGGSKAQFKVCTRNLSAGGLSFLYVGYLHLKSPCQITLPTVDGEPKVIAGSIVACRFVDSRYHEVGVRFEHKIDPLNFIDPQNDADAPDMTDLERAVKTTQFLKQVAAAGDQLPKVINPPDLKAAQNICLDLKRAATAFEHQQLAHTAGQALDMLDATASIAKSVPQIMQVVEECRSLTRKEK